MSNTTVDNKYLSDIMCQVSMGSIDSPSGILGRDFQIPSLETNDGPTQPILPQPALHCQRADRAQGNYRCNTCGKAFSATEDTPFYRLHKAPDVVTLVLTLLCHGYPMQAIVVAFGFDERTIANWQAQVGQHCQRLHEHLVQQGQVDLQHVQADELWVKMVGRRVWMAMAMAVPSRL